MDKNVKQDKALIGAAGVHFVCGELLRRGINALPTTRNTKGADIYAITPKKRLSIQVKTTTNAERWPVPREDKIQVEKDYYFVFVNLRSTEERPDYYMMPSEDLKDYVTKRIKAWKAEPGKRGKPHAADNPFRLFDFSTKYAPRIDPGDIVMDRVLRKILAE
jgi:hypothetical protein